MKNVSQLLIESEIHEIKGRYCRYIDTKEWVKVAELFQPEATFSGFGSAPDGSRRDEFIKGVSSRLKDAVSVHHCHTPEIAMRSPSRVRAIWVMEDYVEWPYQTSLVEAAGAVGYRGYGFYEDEYVLTSAGWRIVFSRLSRLRVDALMPLRPKISYGWSRPDTNWLLS